MKAIQLQLEQMRIKKEQIELQRKESLERLQKAREAQRESIVSFDSRNSSRNPNTIASGRTPDQDDFNIYK